MFQADIVQKIKIHFIFANFFLEIGAVYNNVGGKIKIAAIPLQQWFRESATVFRYAHTAFLLHDDEVNEAVQNQLKKLLGTFWEALNSW